MDKQGELEQSLLEQQLQLIGVDEVGRGCLAGPVYCAAVTLNYESLNQLSDQDKALIRDSKTLSQRQRAQAIKIIDRIGVSQAVSSSSAREIEKLGINKATFKAMRQSIRSLSSQPDSTLVIVDGKQTIPRLGLQQRAVIKGDSSCYAIAAASILAKESRDSYMQKQASKYEGYGFERNVGYGTKEHLQAIKTQGACTLHRRNFSPLKESLI